jgi:hypothetical protein
MVSVKVNGTDIGFNQPEAGTIADVIGTVSQDLDDQLRIIKVSYNGEDITGLPERHMQTINGSGDFELVTARAVDLANETLDSIVEFHGAVVKELSHTAEMFRSTSFEQANERLLRCIDGLHVLTRTTLSVATLFQVSSAEVEAGQYNLEKLPNKMSDILAEMIQAQENRDSILIADLIEYELQVLLEDWMQGISSLQRLGQS